MLYHDLHSWFPSRNKRRRRFSRRSSTLRASTLPDTGMGNNRDVYRRALRKLKAGAQKWYMNREIFYQAARVKYLTDMDEYWRKKEVTGRYDASAPLPTSVDVVANAVNEGADPSILEMSSTTVPRTPKRTNLDRTMTSLDMSPIKFSGENWKVNTSMNTTFTTPTALGAFDQSFQTISTTHSVKSGPRTAFFLLAERARRGNYFTKMQDTANDLPSPPRIRKKN